MGPYRATARLLALAVGLALAPSAAASYAFYVGKGLTADGSVLIGGSGDEPSSHWLVLRPRERHPPGATVTVGATAAARLPGERTEIPQAPETYRYLAHYYSHFAGFPAPLTNGGLNEHGVAVRTVWSPSRPELVAMTPADQSGPSYSDLARIALERARSAAEAVEVIGALIDEHGYTSYGGNSHLIADAEEGWVVVQMAGGRGLWVAERLGPEEVRFSYPGYILEVPADFADHPDYRGAPHLIDFAVEQGWYDPGAGKPFDVNAVYGTGEGRAINAIAETEARLRAAAPVTLEAFKGFVRDPRIALDTTGYGQVAQLRRGVAAELQLLWAAPTASSTAPFLPYWLGVEEVPPEYRRHRYLTDNEAARFQDPAYQLQEATRYAFRVFKRLMYLACDRPERFYDEVRAALEGFEARLREDQRRIERTAEVLLAAGEPALARGVLTDYTSARSEEALRLGAALADGIEARTRAELGMRAPDEGLERDYVWCAEPLRPERR